LHHDGRYPGSIALHLAASRAGRATLGAQSWRYWWLARNPLDQFICRTPDYFFGHSRSHCRITSDNL
jgi:hypothetical protein